MSAALARLLKYTESELDPAVQAEIMLESARIEGRIAILELLAGLVFGAFYRFNDPVFTGIAVFALITVVPFVVDGFIRRSAAKVLLGQGPQPSP